MTKIDVVKSKHHKKEVKQVGKIICIANQKGGVGKSSVTCNLGAALTLEGKSILLIDMDSQCSLTMSLGYQPENFETSSVTILDAPTKCPMCIYETDIECLSIIPASPMLSTLEMSLYNKKDNNLRLKKALEKVKEIFDYILIDCSPALSLSTINGLIAADYVLIPAETKISSNFSLNTFITTVNTVKEVMNSNIEILGVIATMYYCQANEDKEVLKDLQENYEVLGVIRRTTAVSSAFSSGKPCVLTSRRSLATKEFKEIAKKIIDKVEDK